MPDVPLPPALSTLTAPDADEWLTDEQAAALLGIKPRTFIEWRKTKGIPFVFIGSKVARTRRGDLGVWMARQRRVRVATLPDAP